MKKNNKIIHLKDPGPEIKVGCFYLHDQGRAISICGQVKTEAFGAMWFIEETDKTGHSVSIVESTTRYLGQNWTEIGRVEFVRLFNTKVSKKEK